MDTFVLPTLLTSMPSVVIPTLNSRKKGNQKLNDNLRKKVKIIPKG